MAEETKLRTSYHCGKQGSDYHNGRGWQDEKSDISCVTFDNNDIIGSDLRFYEKRYQKALDIQNEKYRQKRNYNRIKDMTDWVKSKQKAPTETILQIGKMTDIIDENAFIDCVNEFLEYREEWSKQHGNHLQFISASIHFDEASPHLHLREVFDYRNNDGVLTIGQEEALRRAGVELPDPNRKEDRLNNRRITFDIMMRVKWQDICEEHGFEIEREPIKPSKDDPYCNQHLTVQAYKAKKEGKRMLNEAYALSNKVKEREKELDKEVEARVFKSLSIKRKSLDKKEIELKNKELALQERERRFKAEKEKVRRLHDELEKQVLQARREAQKGKDIADKLDYSLGTWVAFEKEYYNLASAEKWKKHKKLEIKTRQYMAEVRDMEGIEDEDEGYYY